MDNTGINGILMALPGTARREICALSARRGGVSVISELRLRSSGRCTVTVAGERIALGSRIDHHCISDILSALYHGSYYSYRDCIADGYMPLPGGVRVGISGRAGYDGGRLVGVSNVTSLVFRIPTSAFFAESELLSAYLSAERGILIYSPPGGGKTSALRSLAASLGRLGTEVAVVDERCEFIPDDYVGVSVDILRGYRRTEGCEIALRSLAPEVIMVDELSSLGESEGIMHSLLSGVRIVATAHASSAEEVKKRSGLRPFFEHGVFDMLVGIAVSGTSRELYIDRC